MKRFKLSFTITGEGKEFEKAIGEIQHRIAGGHMIANVPNTKIETDFIEEEIK